MKIRSDGIADHEIETPQDERPLRCREELDKKVDATDVRDHKVEIDDGLHFIRRRPLAQFGVRRVVGIAHTKTVSDTRLW